ncbi:ATP-binding response regulator [Rhodovibrio salinarum]|uniref:histidine kinase n=1 Tax=Rhodovibrio salinarum TaxID=1087 RepID=A0A934V229_9PROT|nr:ATP-binding protein [Rhodovibrio salinarum]MBK1698936.1 hybrid sensor histidine kinase/response regulator [Rhodovibrio salinarum]
MPNRPETSPFVTWPADRLILLFQEACPALVDETIRLAVQKGYADRTSSLRGAWTEAAERLNACLAAYLSDPWRHAGLNGLHDYRGDACFDRLRELARRHRAGGVSLELHNGLFKLYRRVYLKHFAAVLAVSTDREPPLRNPDAFLTRLDDFFDEAELAMLAPWAEGGSEDAVLGERLRRLTQERDQYFAALESLRDPVFIASNDGKLVTANRAAMQVFLDLSEAGALTYRLALQPHRIELQAIVDEVLGTKGSHWDAVWLQTSRGSRAFDIRLRVVEDVVDKIERWRIILMHDVTEHSNAVEAARQAEHTMSLFLAAMSHEIRVPLHSVLGAANLMKDATPGDFEKLLDLLDSSARSLSETLENVLSFSRFEHQAPQPRPENVALHEAVRDLVHTKQIIARQQGVPLNLTIAPNVPRKVRLDWSMAQQVLSNIIQNALRYDDGRGVAVDLGFDGSALVILITDHGSGLPEDIRDMLASPPDNLRPRTTERNGSGLGLAIAQRMILALGGAISVPNSDEGTSIVVKLPFTPVEAEQDAVEPIRRDLSNMTCLVVDDDPINVLVTVAMLERLGFSVDHAQTIDQAHALRLATPDSYDIFIIDYQLPDGRGVDLARMLRQRTAHADTPIFLLSADVGRVRQAPEDAKLFTALLEKPLGVDALAQALRTGVTRTTTSLHMLADLSPRAQRRMTEAFGESWAAFLALLNDTNAEDKEEEIAKLAHKLVSGATIFGLQKIVERLRYIEISHTDPSYSAQARIDARQALAACKLPEHWADDLERFQL